MGTMHVKNSDAYRFVDQAKELILQCHTYIGEMNLNDPDLENLSDMFLLEDGNLLELYGEKKFDKMRDIIKKAFDIDILNLVMFKPLVVSNMIAEAVLTKEYDVALDHHLWAYALRENRVMKGLESAQDQYEIMLRIHMSYQMKSLADIARNVSKFRKGVMKLSAYYAEGKLTELYKTSKKSMGELRGLMIYDRNKEMVKRLIPQLNDSCFIAVGAAHLPGEKGIIALLKREGYTLTPL